MNNRLSPDFKTHRASTFQRDSQQTINSQRSAHNNVEDLLPTFIKQSKSFNRQLLAIRLGGEAQQVLSINAPSLRNELKSTKELNRSNVSIVNQFFSQQAPQTSARAQDNHSSTPEKQTVQTLIGRKDLEVTYFKQELDRLRQQGRIDKVNIDNLQESLRQAQLNKNHENVNLQKEKETLQQRLANIEKEMEILQKQMIDKSKVSLTLSSISNNKVTEALQHQKDVLQRQLTSLMRKDIQMQNELQYYKIKVTNLEKELQDTRNDTPQVETYKRQIAFELNILTNLNESLMKENEHLKATMKIFESHNRLLEGQVTHNRLQIADMNLHEEKKVLMLQSELRTMQRQLQEKNFEMSVMEGQLKGAINSKTIADTQKDNMIVRLQEYVRSLSADLDKLTQENQTLNRTNNDLRFQINEARKKCQDTASLAQNLKNQNENIMVASRHLIAGEADRKHYEETVLKLSSDLQEQRMLLVIKDQRITELSNRLQEKINEGRVAQSDFARIQMQISSIKTHLKGEVEQLTKEKQILADSNRDLRLQMQSEANNHNTVVHILNVKLDDREKRVAALQRQRNSFESEKDNNRVTFRNELQEIKASFRKEQINYQALQSKLNEEQYKLQQSIREKGDLAIELNRVRDELRLHEQRKTEGHHLNLVVEELRRQIVNIQEQAKSNAELAHNRFLNEVNQKSNELLNLQKQYRRITSRFQETELALRQKQNDVQRYRKEHQEVEQLRRIAEEYRMQVKHLQIQLSDRSSQANYKLSELQHYQQLFQLKEPQLIQLVKNNISRLILSRHNQLQTSDRREQLLTQVIEVIDSMGVQIGDLKHYIRDLQEEYKKKLEELDRLQVELNSLNYEKGHLVNEMESLVGRLKYVENYAQYLTSIVKSSDAEGKRLKSLNKSLKTKLQKEFSQRQWLQNRVKNSVQTSNPHIQKAKQQRLNIYNMMKEVIDINKH